MKVVKVTVLSIVITIALVLTVGLCYIVNVNINPLIANELALMQMQNSADSSFWIANYSMFVNLANNLPFVIAGIWFVPVIIGVLLFRKKKNKGTDKVEE